jgi:hypothetical protein
MRTLRLLNLHCNKTHDNNDDNTKPDETFLTIDNGRFRGFGPESMMNGSDWNINAEIQFNEKAIISFYDDDLICNLSTITHSRITLLRKMRLMMGQKKLVLLLITQIMF